MNFDLSEEQRCFVETARAFSQRELAPHAARWDAEREFPKNALKRAGEIGFMSMYTPADAGGLGLSRIDASLIVEELAAGCTSTAAYLTIHNMALWMIASYANEEAKAHWIAPLLNGSRLLSYCLTEPDAGSDAASLRMRAVKVDGGYRLFGEKAFISGAGSTDTLVVMARVEDRGASKQGAKGISAFIVDAHAEGVSYGQQERKMGWNSQPTGAIHFDDVFVPTRDRLGQEGDGFSMAMRGLDGGRINIATCSIGTAQAALDDALRYSRERKQFGQAISEFQNTQFRLSDMATQLVASRTMVHLAAARLDANHPEATALCAMAKRFATDACFEVCNAALQLHGGYGYLQAFPLERRFRDVRVHQILEGTNDVMRVIIARRLLLNETSAAIR
jgi:alkylation response protein AidB-like acyl-CoA dehydrogenase